MERNRSNLNKNRGFYIAVCCCVSVVAIVGYVSWFTGKSAPDKAYSPENKISEIQAVPEISKVSVKEEVPERKSIPATEKTSPASKNVITDDNTPEFKKPVNGKIIGEFSGDTLVYHEELADWRSHSGIDFKAKEGDKVLASADGIVERVYSSGMGNCVLIDHENGIKSLYANLAPSDIDITGRNVVQGEEIGAVGSSALSDLTKEAHLHFEILKDDKPVNPTEYITSP